jgi:hypothetical protein
LYLWLSSQSFYWNRKNWVQLVYVYFQVPIAFEFRGNRWTSTRFQMNEGRQNLRMYFYVLQCSWLQVHAIGSQEDGNEGLHTFGGHFFTFLAIGYTSGVPKG